MLYQLISELPDSVRNVLSKHAQDIYKEAFDQAWENYKRLGGRRVDIGGEEVVHQVAWSAVKNTHEKGTDKKWHQKR